jgi:hypothetical protein
VFTAHTRERCRQDSDSCDPASEIIDQQRQTFPFAFQLFKEIGRSLLAGHSFARCIRGSVGMALSEFHGSLRFVPELRLSPRRRILSFAENS